MFGKRTQLMLFQELVNIECTGQVGGVVTIVITREAFALHGALFDEELPPGMIAVAAQQGVVEIENGEAHGLLRFVGRLRINRFVRRGNEKRQ